MHARAAWEVCRRALAAAAFLTLSSGTSFAVGVPAIYTVESSRVAQPPLTEAVPPAEPAATEAAEPAPEYFLLWEFSYKGPGVRAQGQITTSAEVSPDGTYEILAVNGKRNRREIITLEPAGELRTMYGLLFSDNRLWAQSPYFTQGGFSFRDKHARLFNVCYTGPYEGCGEAGELGYFEEDFRGSKPIPIAFTLKQIGPVEIPATEVAGTGNAPQPVATCRGDAAQAPATALDGTTVATVDKSGAFQAPADSTCVPDAIQKNRL